MVRIAIKPKSLAPEALMSAIRAETRMPTRWVGARAIQRRIGGTSSSISRGIIYMTPFSTHSAATRMEAM